MALCASRRWRMNRRILAEFSVKRQCVFCLRFMRVYGTRVLPFDVQWLGCAEAGPPRLRGRGISGASRVCGSAGLRVCGSAGLRGPFTYLGSWSWSFLISLCCAVGMIAFQLSPSVAARISKQLNLESRVRVRVRVSVLFGVRSGMGRWSARHRPSDFCVRSCKPAPMRSPMKTLPPIAASCAPNTSPVLGQACTLLDMPGLVLDTIARRLGPNDRLNLSRTNRQMFAEIAGAKALRHAEARVQRGKECVQWHVARVRDGSKLCLSLVESHARRS